MDPYEGDGDEFMTARSQSFDEPAFDTGNYRADALPPGGSDAFDIAAFRRQQGWPQPPPRPVPQPPAPAQAPRIVDADDDTSSSEDDSSSLRSLSTRTLSGGNPRYDPIAPLNRGRQGAPSNAAKPAKRGFFSKLWSLIKGRGWR